MTAVHVASYLLFFQWISKCIATVYHAHHPEDCQIQKEEMEHFDDFSNKANQSGKEKSSKTE